MNSGIDNNDVDSIVEMENGTDQYLCVNSPGFRHLRHWPLNPVQAKPLR